ncbi:MAG: flavodoxin [Clostridia bacterium]|nr:flavodoxin [Clostridia bacterium]
MQIAVRYYSRSGNTKTVADAIAEEAGVKAVSVGEDEASLSEPADVLFIGGALYAYGLDRRLSEYLKNLKADDAKKAVVFSTSWLSRHSVDLIKKGLAEAGIPVEQEYYYAKNRPSAEQLEEAKRFARKFL